MLKDGDEKPNVPSSMIAEEAVDQLQASEKLIAGIYKYIFINYWCLILIYFHLNTLFFYNQRTKRNMGRKIKTYGRNKNPEGSCIC